MIEKRWNSAVYAYGSAFEIAEILFNTRTGTQEELRSASERYIQSAVEFTYALKKSHFECNTSILIKLVKERLLGHLPKGNLIDVIIVCIKCSFSHKYLKYF